MSKKLQILAGAAMFAALALAGALGIFAFSGAQPVHAQTASGDVTRSFSAMQVATGGSVDVTITLNTGLAVEVTETLPGMWDYQSASVETGDGTVDVTENGQMISFLVLSGEPVTYTVMAPGTDGRGMFSGMFAVTGTPNISVGGDMYVTVGAGDGGGGNGGMMMRNYPSSVTARPDDPGAATQITVKFMTSEFLDIGDSITLEVEDDLGVPSSISADDVDIRGTAAEGENSPIESRHVRSANPQSVIVDTNAPDERHVLELVIGNMDDSADELEDLGLFMGEVTVTFRQNAGITNRTEGGDDDWFVETTQEGLLDTLPETADLDEGQIETVYGVPWTITLSSYADSRGERITAVGKGFKNGTTTKFWRDANRNGMIDSGETELCDGVANGDDIAECEFTLSNPPFKPRARRATTSTPLTVGARPLVMTPKKPGCTPAWRSSSRLNWSPLCRLAQTRASRATPSTFSCTTSNPGTRLPASSSPARLTFATTTQIHPRQPVSPLGPPGAWALMGP